MTATSKSADINVMDDRRVPEGYAAVMRAVVHRRASADLARSAVEGTLLDSVLKTVRVTGAAYFDVAAQEPWSLHSPDRELIVRRVLPGADRLIAYHTVIAGRCFANFHGGEAVPLEAGEAMVFINSDPHTISSTPGMCAPPPRVNTIAVADAGLPLLQINPVNSGAGSARLVSGYLACDERLFSPLLRALPPMLKAGDPHRNDDSGPVHFVHLAMAEIAEQRPGSQAVLMRLSELMLIDVVRRYSEALPKYKSGWLAALQDPTVGKALSLIHLRPH